MEKIRFPAKIVANNRITIPQNFVESYGLAKGEWVDVEIAIKRKGDQ